MTERNAGYTAKALEKLVLSRKADMTWVGHIDRETRTLTVRMQPLPCIEIVLYLTGWRV
jgi:hypothetical protein